MRSTTTCQSNAAAFVRPASRQAPSQFAVVEDARRSPTARATGVARRHEQGVDTVGRDLPVALDVGGDHRHPAAMASTTRVPEALLPGGGSDGNVGARRGREGTSAWSSRPSIATRDRADAGKPIDRSRGRRRRRRRSSSRSGRSLGERSGTPRPAPGTPSARSSRCAHAMRRSGRPRQRCRLGEPRHRQAVGDHHRLELGHRAIARTPRPRRETAIVAASRRRTGRSSGPAHLVEA